MLTNVALVTICDETQQDYGLHTTANKYRYCVRHGYTLIAHTRTLFPARPTAWSKILAIRDALKAHDIVLWTDADAAIVDQEADLSRWCSEPEIEMIIAAENGSVGYVHGNSGVLIFRRTERVFKLLDDWWNAPPDDSPVNIGSMGGGPWDQKWLLRLLREDPTRVSMAIAGDELNAAPHRVGWKFIVHPFGMAHEEKLNVLRQYS